jgi:hypothetical protein
MHFEAMLSILAAKTEVVHPTLIDRLSMRQGKPKKEACTPVQGSISTWPPPSSKLPSISTMPIGIHAES